MTARKPTGAGSPRLGCRHTKFHEAAQRILAETLVYAYRQGDIIYPNGLPKRYVRALVDIAKDSGVQGKAAWLLEQRSRLRTKWPNGVIDHCMIVAAWNVAEGRAATKRSEVEEWRRTLIEYAAGARAEAEAAASLGHRDLALGLRLGAQDVEALAASRYEVGDPTLVTNRSCDASSDKALALGTMRALTQSLLRLYGSPLAGVAAAFVFAATRVKVTRDQARLITTHLEAASSEFTDNSFYDGMCLAG